MSSSSPVARLFRVRGRVQGVSYRFATVRAAGRLELTGWVRNLPDGSVEALAVGSSEQLERFREFLRTGSAMARVTSVEEEPAEAAIDGMGFRVRA